MSLEALRLLHTQYDKKTLKPDLFGRRPALPSEVKRVVQPATFAEQVNLYLPTQRDIEEKGDK